MIANYISARHNGAKTKRQAGMLRALKYLLILAVLGVIGLFAYSYLMEPEAGPVTETIEIDAG